MEKYATDDAVIFTYLKNLYPEKITTTDPDEAVKRSMVKSMAFYCRPEKKTNFFTSRMIF